jgi:hypothetical protein
MRLRCNINATWLHLYGPRDRGLTATLKNIGVTMVEVTRQTDASAKASNIMGKALTSEYSECGHQEVNTTRGGREIVGLIRSGDANRVKEGLHTLAGHVTPSPQITNLVPDKLKGLREIASGLARGDFEVSSHGALFAGSLLNVAHIADHGGRSVDPDTVLGILEEIKRSPRWEDRDLRGWMIGVSIDALNRSLDADAGVRLLQDILKDPQLAAELKSQSPSTVREAVLRAAPSLCRPELFEVYLYAIRFGDPIEKGLGLLSIAEVPNVIHQLGVHHPWRQTLISWAQTYKSVMQTLLEARGNNEPLVIPHPHGGHFSETDLTRIIRALTPSES